MGINLIEKRALFSSIGIRPIVSRNFDRKCSTCSIENLDGIIDKVTRIRLETLV
ncbi:MAG: hypothetical protein KAH84_11945 [Thiomargarita sp.]|nr:hypothetical protein [Thiomargarita sp.]